MNQMIDLASHLHPEALKILLVLGLSFLLGLEREGRKASAGHYIFGGVRTFPMIGLLGYLVALISGPQLLAVAVGLLAVAAFLLVSYLHKLRESEDAGVTTEFTGMVTYMLGALVFYGHFWIATTVVVVAMLLLELKVGLESLSERISTEDVVTFTKFLLLTAVILPAVPQEDFGPFRLNPFKTWLVVVAVSGISYGSYVLQKVTRKRGGIVLAALLGGAYSSTVMTVVLARRAKREDRPHLFSGAMLMASGMMFLRLVVLLLIFSKELLAILLWPFLTLAAAALLGGFLWTRVPDDDGADPEREYQAKNPLELRSAFAFAAIFVALVVSTSLVLKYFGQIGMYALAVVMGAVDVDPFIMGLAQSAGTTTPLQAAAAAILVTTASNNLMKGIYALSFADRRTGLQGLAGLLLIALVGVGWMAFVL
jgi:uncharacterized membrane protein (DUF4010 family)